jgi:hypothetical protein
VTRFVRRAGLLLAIAAVMPLAACGGDTALPATEAVGRYDEIAEGISAAIAADGTTWKLAEDTRRTEAVDDACQYTPGTWRPAGALPVAEDEALWQERIDAVNPVLEQHGFAPVDELTQDGSREVLESEDEHGATVRLTADGELRIWGARVDAAPCTLEQLQAS